MASCPAPPIDMNQLLQYFILKAAFTEEEANIDALLDAVVSQQVSDSLIQEILKSVPPEFADVICTMRSLEAVKALRAALRGEEYESGLEKMIELAVTLQVLGAFQGGDSTATTA